MIIPVGATGSASAHVVALENAALAEPVAPGESFLGLLTRYQCPTGPSGTRMRAVATNTRRSP